MQELKNSFMDLSKLLDASQNNYRRILYVKLKDGYIPLNKFVNNGSEELTSGLYIKTFCGRDVYLPAKLSSDLLYFLGVVAGDGSLPFKFNDRGKRMYIIEIEKANKDFILGILKPLAEKLFKIEWSYLTRKRTNRKRVWNLYLYSKPLYLYLTRLFDFPTGKKSHKIRIPELVRKLDPEDRLPFIVGIMDTDWGLVGNKNFGTHCASRILLEDIRDAIKHFLNIKLKIRKIIQGKYTSYQMRVLKSEMPKLSALLNSYFPLKNQKRIKAFKTELYRT